MVPTLPFLVHARLIPSVAACRKPTGVQATPTLLPSAQSWSPEQRGGHTLVCQAAASCTSLLHAPLQWGLMLHMPLACGMTLHGA